MSNRQYQRGIEEGYRSGLEDKIATQLDRDWETI